MLEEIQVTFHLSQRDGRICGQIDSDPLGRRKVVFVTDDKLSMPPYLRHHRVSQGERWICRVIRDTKRNDPSHGALIVALVWPTFLKFDAAFGRTVFIPLRATRMMQAQPEVLRVLEEAIARIELPRDGSELGVEVEMEEPLAKNRLIQVSPVGYDEMCDFAFRVGRYKPSRVARAEPDEVVSTVVLRAVKNMKADGTYVLRTAYIGTLSPREPWACNDEGELSEKSFPFWSGHALAYDQATMSRTFRASWREVIESQVEDLRAFIDAPEALGDFSRMSGTG